MSSLSLALYIYILPRSFFLIIFLQASSANHRREAISQEKKRKEERPFNRIVSIFPADRQTILNNSFLTTHIRFLHVIYRSALTYWISISFGFSFCFLNGNSGCLAKLQCRNKRYNSFNEPLKGRSFQDQKAFKRNVSAGFWTTTTCEMDNSTKQSNLTMDGSSSGNFPTEFVNQGLILWTQMRQRWVGKKKPRSRGHQSREARISWNETYESLLTTNKHFTQPIPLTEMVDFLVDVWDQEGLYD